jgi:hypothetical protein
MIINMLMSIALMTTVNLDMQITPWRSVNDGVMGGLSAGGMVQSDEDLKFVGKLSLENNGGFSSVRRLVEQDLSSATRVRLEVRGDGRDYQVRIRQSNRFDGVAWSAAFSTTDKWKSIEMAFDEFIPVFRGRTVTQAGPVVPSEIQQIGFLLADRNPGRFELEIKSIEFLGPEATAAP